MTISHYLRSYADELRTMSGNGIYMSPHEMAVLASRLDDVARVIDQTVVFEPARVVALRPALAVIRGGVA